ncbi:cytochrome b/b6 domain-containing protein [Cellvibrio sp. OA-2007]|uniref:cytochrome b/b6 domain-containing protein n=1 Tax=Cellvibrio sp. OA-2007 TaxID=529823 RepID=UPI000780CF97|nr:cytochrome b/b6 domain-containing protein [Cellvibrio sp. OA-2007]
MSQTTPTAVITAQQRLWDWPVRICHWSMVMLIAACWWTAEEHEIVYHSYCAYALLGVVLFRIYWGFFGSSTARFSQFLRKPSAVFAYLKSLGQREVKPASGHNPLGGYSVLALLFVVLLQIGLGLFAIDVDGFDGGPFADYLSFKTSRMITGWHEIIFNVLLAFIALHIAAIVYYLLWRRQNLTAAMLRGKTSAPGITPMQPASITRAIAGIALAGLSVWLILSLPF